jgi:hypothetical protein
MSQFKVGDKVVKNAEGWIESDFDQWGAGEGIGIILKAPFPLEDKYYDVRWPRGRCFKRAEELCFSENEEK